MNFDNTDIPKFFGIPEISVYRYTEHPYGSHNLQQFKLFKQFKFGILHIYNKLKHT